MNKNASLLFAIFLLPLLVHAADYPVGMKLFGYYAVPTGTGFSVENFSFQNSSAYAIVSGGEVYSLLVPNFPFVMPKPLVEKGKIEPALEAYYYSKGLSPVRFSDIEPLHLAAENLSSRRRAGESECRRLMGTDHLPCTDFDSCMLACFSVTSFCQYFLYGGNPGDFVYVVWEFENNTHELDSAYEREQAAFAAAEINTTEKTADAYVDAVASLWQAALFAKQSPIFLYYSFCPNPDYAVSELGAISSSAQGLYMNAEPLYGLSQTAAIVQNRTLAAMEKERQFKLQDIWGAGALPEEAWAEEKAKRQEQYEKEKSESISLFLVLPFVAGMGTMFALGIALLIYASLAKMLARAKAKPALPAKMLPSPPCPKAKPKPGSPSKKRREAPGREEPHDNLPRIPK